MPPRSRLAATRVAGGEMASMRTKQIVITALIAAGVYVGLEAYKAKSAKS